MEERQRESADFVKMAQCFQSVKVCKVCSNYTPAGLITSALFQGKWWTIKSFVSLIVHFKKFISDVSMCVNSPWKTFYQGTVSSFVCSRDVIQEIAKCEFFLHDSWNSCCHAGIFTHL